MRLFDEPLEERDYCRSLYHHRGVGGYDDEGIAQLAREPVGLDGPDGRLSLREVMK